MNTLTLILDPFGISEATGLVVSDARTEREAFILVDRLLGEGHEGGSSQTVIVRGPSCQHFESYRGRLRGVHAINVTPRSVLRERFASSPPCPEWLTDQLIHSSALIELIPADADDCTEWAKTIVRYLLPGINEVAGLTEWFLVVADADGFPAVLAGTPVMDHIVEQFREVCAQSLASQEIMERLVSKLASCSSPLAFASEWLRRVAVLPLHRGHLSRTLGPRVGTQSPPQDPIALFIAGQLPLAFPLPTPLHQEISALFVSAVRSARLHGGKSLEDVALALNAWWDGVEEELQTWLTISPRDLTTKATNHLRSLPGFEGNRTAGQLIEHYSPPLSVPEWSGIDECFDVWVERYAEFIRSAFFRRDLPTEPDDPATGFGRWIKDNHTVCFEHPERGYSVLARKAQAAISAERTVILVIVDALGVHLVRDMIGYMNDELGVTPTSATYVFAPVPTVTEVCKQAILTGSHPDASETNLHTVLGQVYNLTQEQVILAANWRDAERVRISRGHRLIVYRDNRLDDRLKSVACFRELLDDCANIFPRLAHTVARWSRDICHVSGQEPLLLLCADHGFTYGPMPTNDSTSPVITRRCVVAESREEYASDSSATYIDKNVFHLKSSYAATVGRFRGTDTVTGWQFSHGGLLPEEVLIPIVEWHGDVQVVAWPQISFTGTAVLSNGHWHLSVVIDNPTNIPLCKAMLGIAPAGRGNSMQTVIPAIRPHSSYTIAILVPDPCPCCDDEIPFDVSLQLQPTEGDSVSRTDQYFVAREKQLVETTPEQQDFEAMF